MMNIVMAGDCVMKVGMEVVIYSTMLHNKNIHWYILTGNIDVHYTEETGTIYHSLKRYEDELRFMVKFMDSNSELDIIDCEEYYEKYLQQSVNNTSMFTPYAAFRLIIDKILDIDKCLWFDADLLISGNLTSLYNDYLKENSYAAYTAQDAINCCGEMVSGVLVIDVIKARKSGLLNRALYNYNHFVYQYPDQESLRRAGNYDEFPELYDYIHDIKKIYYTPTIIHFTNENPMKIYENNNEHIGLFWKTYPEFIYIRDGIEKIKEVYSR